MLFKISYGFSNCCECTKYLYFVNYSRNTFTYVITLDTKKATELSKYLQRCSVYFTDTIFNGDGLNAVNTQVVYVHKHRTLGKAKFNWPI